jgi:hypothetical protein
MEISAVASGSSRFAQRQNLKLREPNGAPIHLLSVNERPLGRPEVQQARHTFSCDPVSPALINVEAPLFLCDCVNRM